MNDDLSDERPWQNHEVERAIDHCEERIAELEAENAKLRALLESLTPGGSEFAGSPDRCVEWVRKRLSTLGKVAAERNRLRALLPPEAVIDSVRWVARTNFVMGNDAAEVRAWLDKLESEGE